MRATVLLKDDLVFKARKLTAQKSLSDLLNACLADWIAQHDGKQLDARLAAEYRDGEADARREERDFSAIDKQGWPDWRGERSSFSRRIKRRRRWLAVLKACPVPMDDLGARSRDYGKKPKL